MKNKAADRIRKLLALASNNPSDEEAAAAFALAQELASRHQLDLDDLILDEHEPGTARRVIEEIHEQQIAAWRRATAWQLRLAGNIAELNRCRTYYLSGDGGGLWVYGQASDVATVSYLYAAIEREVDRRARAETRGKSRSWGRNFRLGVVDTLHVRMAQAHGFAQAKAREDAFARAGEAGLVRVDQALAHNEKIVETVDHYGENVLGIEAGSRMAPASSYGYQDGRMAGHEVELGHSGRSIGTGPRALKGDG